MLVPLMLCYVTPYPPYVSTPYFINSFDYPYLLFQFPTDAAPVSLETIPTILVIFIAATTNIVL